MIINFYSTNSPNNAINKNLTLIAQASGVLKTETQIENPTIKDVDFREFPDTTQDDILNANYCYIPEFKRFYYITNKNVVNNDFIDMQLSVDVLMSYKEQIINQKCLIERSQFYNSPYITDNAKAAYNFPMVLTRKFANSFDAFHYYFVVANGAETNTNEDVQNSVENV